jgi:ferredoxin
MHPVAGTGDNRIMPSPDFADESAATVDIDLDGTRHRLRWPRDKTLVEVMLDAGIDVPYSCQEGHCGSCVTTVTAGEVVMDACDILDATDRADGLILACQARPVGDDVRVEY